MQSGVPITISDLPDDILKEEIMPRLNATNLLLLSSTSKRFQEIYPSLFRKKVRQLFNKDVSEKKVRKRKLGRRYLVDSTDSADLQGDLIARYFSRWLALFMMENDIDSIKLLMEFSRVNHPNLITVLANNDPNLLVYSDFAALMNNALPEMKEFIYQNIIKDYLCVSRGRGWEIEKERWRIICGVDTAGDWFEDESNRGALTKDESEFLIHHAVCSGNLSFLQRNVSAVCSILRSQIGLNFNFHPTLYESAAVHAHFAVMDWLSLQPDFKGIPPTALHSACKAGQEVVVEYLINKFRLTQPSRIHFCHQGFGATALVQAVKSNNLNIVDMLLKQRVDINVRPDNSHPALHCAVEVAINTGLFEVLDRLLRDEKTDIDLRTNYGYGDHKTALARAIMLLSEKPRRVGFKLDLFKKQAEAAYWVVKKLLGRGADSTITSGKSQANALAELDGLIDHLSDSHEVNVKNNHNNRFADVQDKIFFKILPRLFQIRLLLFADQRKRLAVEEVSRPINYLGAEDRKKTERSLRMFASAHNRSDDIDKVDHRQQGSDGLRQDALPSLKK